MAESKYSTYVYVGCLILLGASLFTVFYVWKFSYLPYIDSRMYADVARSLYDNQTLTVQHVMPLTLSVSPELRHHPNLKWPPLFPVLVALSFGLFGVSDFSVILVSGVFYVLAGPVVFLLGKALFDRRVGFYASLLFLTIPRMAGHGIMGLSETTFIVLAWTSLYLIYERRNPWIVGLFLGLAFYTRFVILIWLPGVLFLVDRFYDRSRPVLLKVLGCMGLVILPWLLRSYFLIGTPFFISIQTFETASMTSLYPNFSLYQELHPASPLGFVVNNPSIMFQKIYSQVLYSYKVFPLLIRNFLIYLVGFYGLVEVMRSPSGEGNRHKKKDFFVGVGLMLAAQFVFTSVYVTLVRYYVPFLPVLSVLAAYGIVECSSRFSGETVAGVGVLTLVLVNIACMPLQETSPRVRPDEMRYVRDRTEPDDVILTNAISELPWYADRIGLLYPTYDDFREINDRIGRVDYAYFNRRSDFARRSRGSSRTGVSLGREYLQNPEFRNDFRIIKRFGSSAVFLKRTSDNQ